MRRLETTTTCHRCGEVSVGPSAQCSFDDGGGFIYLSPSWLMHLGLDLKPR
jgi:hypothetical protein